MQTGLEYLAGLLHAFKTWNYHVEDSIAILDLHYYLRKVSKNYEEEICFLKRLGIGSIDHLTRQICIIEADKV